MELVVLSLVSMLDLISSFYLWQFLRLLRPSYLQITKLLLIFAISIQSSFIAFELITTSNIASLPSWFSHIVLTEIVGIGCLGLLHWKRLLPVVLLALVLSSFVVAIVPFYLSSGAILSLPSLWLWLHIVLMIVGEVLFLFSALVSLVYIASSRQLKNRESPSWLTSSLSLPKLDEVLGRLMVAGVFSLSFGILLGGFFAERFWKGAWWLDAKVLFAHFTWLIYFLILLLRWLKPSWRGQKSAWLASLSFFLVLMVSGAIDLAFHTKHDELKINGASDE
ncbi:MAG: hypothetical protein COV44_10405 [Deltaproteobacteria bacterium CG11_big_fil_rev_8_21_14_0_20_45_16]|nr:MAG: hypothetical protein COV44_10405 [Deltaproteobacteria bacterium CG11_big_fil_rev_8_21_14_0_20_45_16]